MTLRVDGETFRLYGGAALLAEGRAFVLGGQHWLSATALHAPPDAVAAGFAESAPRQRVTTDSAELIDELIARGARVTRRAHDYRADLAGWTDPGGDLPDGFALTPLGWSDELLAAHVAAYPPSHPDHDPALDHAAQLAAMLRGEVVGPLCAEASWQVAGPAGARGGIVVVRRPAGDVPPMLWVVDVFLDPAVQGRGLGRALIRHALASARAAGHAAVGLVVTDGNPARALYEAVGFRYVRGGANLELP